MKEFTIHYTSPHRKMVHVQTLCHTEPIVIGIARNGENERPIWMKSVDSFPRRDVNSRWGGLGLRVGMPLSQVIHRSATDVPTVQRGSLVGHLRAFETSPPPAVMLCWSCSFDDVQVRAAAEPQQDPACLRFILGILTKTADCLQHRWLQQHPATGSKWVRSYCRGEHAGQPIRRSRFCDLMFRIRVPSVARVRKRGEGSPRNHAMIASVAKDAAANGADTA